MKQRVQLFHRTIFARVPVILQQQENDCGEACLAMIAQYFGYRDVRLGLRPLATPTGTDMWSLAQRARELGFEARGVHAAPANAHRIIMPCIAHVDGSHFLVVTRLTSATVLVIDPLVGRERLSAAEFWRRCSGSVLLITPGLPHLRAKVQEQLSSASRERRHLLQAFMKPVWHALLPRLATLLLTAAIIQSLALCVPLAWMYVAESWGLRSPSRLVFDTAVIALAFFTLERAIRAFHVRLQRSGATMLDASRRGLLVQLLASNVGKRREISAHAVLRGVRGLGGAAALLEPTAIEGVAALLAVLVCLFALLYVAGTSLFVLSSLTVFASIAVVWLREGRYDTSQRRMHRYERSSAEILISAVNGAEALRMFGASGLVADRWLECQRDVRQVEAYRDTHSVLTAAGNLYTLLAALPILMVVARIGESDSMPFSRAASAVMILMLIGNRLQALAEVPRNSRYIQEERARLAYLLGNASTMSGPSHRIPNQFPLSAKWDGLSEITLCGVTVRGNKRSRRLSLQIARGDRVLLLGQQRSGKTELLRAIARLDGNDGADVLFRGKSVTELGQHTWWRQIHLIPYRPAVFAGTLRDNLLYSCARSNESRIADALALSGLSDLVAASPAGWNQEFHVDVSSVTRSIRFRLALARAFLADPMVLLLDDPPGILEDESLADVWSALHAHFAGRTMVIASQFVDSVFRCERVEPLAEDCRTSEREGAWESGILSPSVEESWRAREH